MSGNALGVLDKLMSNKAPIDDEEMIAAEEILPKESQPEEVRRKVESVLRFVQCEESRAEVALTFASGGEEEENRVEMEAAVKQFVSWRGYGVAALFSEEL